MKHTKRYHHGQLQASKLSTWLTLLLLLLQVCVLLYT